MIRVLDPIGSVARLELTTSHLKSNSYISGKTHIDAAIKSGSKAILLDVSRVEKLKSSEIAILVELVASAQPKALLALVNVPSLVAQHLRDLGIDEVTPLFSSLEKAIKSPDIRSGLMSRVPMLALVSEKLPGLAPLTQACCPSMLNLFGKSLLGHNLTRAADFGIHRVYLNPGHLGERIESEIGLGDTFGQSVFYSREAVTRNQRWSSQPRTPIETLQRHISEHAGFSSDTLVIRGNSVGQHDLYDFYAKHIETGADVTVLVSRAAGSHVESDGSGTQSQHKQEVTDAGPLFEIHQFDPASACLYMFSPSSADLVAEARAGDLDQTFFDHLHQSGGTVEIVETQSAETLVQNGKDYWRAWHRAFSGDFPDVRLGCREIRPNLWINDKYFGDTNLDVDGFAYVGANVDVNGEVALRNAILLDGSSRLEPGAYIRNSILFPGTHASSNALVDGMIAEARWAVSTTFADGTEQPWDPIPELAPASTQSVSNVSTTDLPETAATFAYRTAV